MEQRRIQALIPCFNEAESIASTVGAVLGISEIDSVLVIDDGSKDATARLAEDSGAEVLHLGMNRGKGAALAAGVRLLEAERAPDIVVLLDGDLGASAAAAAELLYPIIDGLADMTIGVLPTPPGSGGFGVVKDLARREIRRLGGGYDAQAPLSGQRALSWPCLQAVLPFARGFGVEVALTIRALQQHFRILEVAVNMQHRATGKTVSGFMHRGKQYLDVYRTIQQLGQNERSEAHKA